MPTNEKKGITVKIDADLHAEIRAYLEANEMTMADFIAMAADNELHPKFKEVPTMEKENMRTLAFQVPESLFTKIKEYLDRYHMTQKQFVLGLIETEIQRDEDERLRDSSPEESEDLEDEETEEEDVAEEDEEDYEEGEDEEDEGLEDEKEAGFEQTM